MRPACGIARFGKCKTSYRSYSIQGSAFSVQERGLHFSYPELGTLNTEHRSLVLRRRQLEIFRNHLVAIVARPACYAWTPIDAG